MRKNLKSIFFWGAISVGFIVLFVVMKCAQPLIFEYIYSKPNQSNSVDTVDIGKEFGISFREMGIPFTRGVQRCVYDSFRDEGIVGGRVEVYLVTPIGESFFSPETIRALDSICKSDSEVWSKQEDTYNLSYSGDQEFNDSIHYSKYTNTIDYIMNIEYVISKDSIKIYYSGGD